MIQTRDTHARSTNPKVQILKNIKNKGKLKRRRLGPRLTRTYSEACGEDSWKQRGRQGESMRKLRVDMRVTTPKAMDSWRDRIGIWEFGIRNPRFSKIRDLERQKNSRKVRGKLGHQIFIYSLLFFFWVFFCKYNYEQLQGFY